MPSTIFRHFNAFPGATLALVVLSSNAYSADAEVADRARSTAEVKEGMQAYRVGQYEAAEKHFRIAVATDPTQQIGWLSLARSIRAQFKPGVQGADNVAKGKEAVATYEKLLERNPQQDEAFAAVADLYGELNNEVKQREWISKRAHSEHVSKEKRGSAYRRLASLDLICARQATAQQAAEGDACASRGMKSIDAAISLAGANEGVVGDKMLLLRERARLAGALGRSSQQAAFEKQATQVEQQLTQLREAAKQKSDSLPTY